MIFWIGKTWNFVPFFSKLDILFLFSQNLTFCSFFSQNLTFCSSFLKTLQTVVKTVFKGTVNVIYNLFVNLKIVNFQFHDFSVNVTGRFVQVQHKQKTKFTELNIFKISSLLLFSRLKGHHCESGISPQSLFKK